MENFSPSRRDEPSCNPWGPTYPCKNAQVNAIIKQMGGSRAYFEAQQQRDELDVTDPRSIAMAQLELLRKNVITKIICIAS